MNGHAVFVKDTTSPTLDDLLDHFDHVANLVGVDHLGIGFDFSQLPGVEMTEARYHMLQSSGVWAKGTLPPPPWRVAAREQAPFAARTRPGSGCRQGSPPVACSGRGGAVMVRILRGGYMGPILDVDLSSGKVGTYTVTDEERFLFLGGKVLAARILWDLLEPGVDPLAPGNVLVITPGVLNGAYSPCSSRFNCSARSPLTGGIASANCGV